MSIHVALHRYALPLRPSRSIPQIRLSLHPQPQSHPSYNLRIEPQHFINWQQDPFQLPSALGISPKNLRIQSHRRPGHRNGGVQPFRFFLRTQRRARPTFLLARAQRRAQQLLGKIAAHTFV
jgi:hypothetical protein